MNEILQNQKIVSERFSKLSTLLLMLFSLFSLISLNVGVGLTLNLFIQPHSAYFFLTLSVGFWFFLLPQEKLMNKYIALFATVLVIILSSLSFITNFQEGSTQIESFLFIVNGIAMLCLFSGEKIIKAISVFLAVILVFISSTHILAYILGSPFFIMGSNSQLSFLTVASFFLLSFTLISSSDKNSFLVKTLWENSTNARLLRMFLPVALLITVAKSIITIYILPLIDIHPAIWTLASSVIIISIIVIAILVISKKLGLSLDTALHHLKESQGKYRTMIETSNDLIWMLDEKGCFTFLNSKAEKTTGLILKEVKGKSFVPFVFKEELEFLNDLFIRIISGETVTYEMRFKTDKGNVIVLAVNTAPLYVNGEIKGMSSFGRDITQRKQTEQLLIESETRFKALHNASFGGIAIHDMGTIKDCNQGLSEITGYSFEELIGMDGLLCIAEGSRPMVRKHIAESYEEPYEVLGLRKNGEEYPLRLEGKSIPYEGKQMRVVEFRDITQRVKAENHIRRLSTAVNQSPSVIVITDTKGILEYVNPRFTEITGYTSSEAIGKESNILKSGEQDASFYEQMWETVETGKVWRGHFHNKKKNGDLFWEAATISAIKDDAGKIINFIKIGEDISELKQAELKLKQSTQLLEASQKIAKLGGWELDIKTQDLYWTDETYYIHDTSPEEFNPTVEAGVAYFLPESQKIISDALEAAMESGEGYDLYLETLTTKGRKIDVRTTCEVSYKDGKPAKLRGIFQDISEQKDNELKLKKALNKALESDHLKSAFLANMSHEIRTPMNGILGFMNLLNQPDLSKAETDQYSKIINKSGERLLNTINDIIDISKIEAGEMNFTKEETSINNIIEEVYAFHAPEATEKGIALVLLPSERPEEIFINTDSQKLHSILTNLTKNAIKFTERGYVKIGFLKRDNFIEFTIQDSGVGIPEHRIHAVFNRFEQADIGDARVFEGSGLGLAISMAYAQMLGGDIKVESVKGEGSTFTCFIPVV